ncbi:MULTISPECIES: hypothetical protein [unclassified Rhizobium]|uniref:hypothetical protein n=1 Tax=unclassified Rhizobium TaxID=2613769 RepID=UPI001A98BAAC|nr:MULTISPECIES: hypothetical protein [unclassified Rhizobium]MBX5158514.1 hypothetical protein [Rhizobium sp. NZLR8]MBX5171454.1 hypothetical protein [Rhizobium sp. NZLR1b]MBX5183518.1 hypothetical protein [Rhizobium sp. NZLR5]MBX5193278.1 hypothetical protein [Rhizobium sp. NZLR3b]MBX5198697.1 hypothetical protein [Rhizobium sp. NZLR10]
MQVATTSASIILRGTPSAAAMSAAGNETDQGVLKLQRSTQTLQQMRQTLANSGDEAKTKAQRKLDEAKQQLEMLRSSNMPPEVVARLAAELARKVGTAASEFASAAATGSPAAVAPVDATTDATAAATSGTEAALTDVSEKTATGSQEPVDAAQAREAYESTAEDAPKSSGISSDDRETMEAFKAVVRELRQLLEKAMHDLRQQDWQGGANAVPDMAGLSTGTATIPTSIVI